MTYRRSVLITFITILGFTPLPAQTQRGKATYYSRRATGARTASGERLHHDSLTCAHRTYPFGTLLKVTNLSNGKEVVVRVTDRGPFVRGRIIDLSWRAAKQLGILAQGVATVKVEVYKETRGIPYRQEKAINLPEIDFEITEGDYKLVDNWTKANPQGSTESTKPPRRKIAEKPHDARQATSSKPQLNPSKLQTNPQHKNKKEGNIWSKIFEKLKQQKDEILK